MSPADRDGSSPDRACPPSGAGADESNWEISGPLRLTVTRQIAAGGMGAVYQAIQHGVEGFCKTVAIKTIREPYSENEEFSRMFVGEAKLVADLVHQNIAQVYQLGRTRDALYIVMEYVEGVNLRQFIERHRETDQRIPTELAAYIASRICRGLEYAHKKRGPDGQLLGVVHRDISPTNVMVTCLGELKILDFGIAKARNLMDQREGELLLGKRAYLSPEQTELKPTDGRSDIFALGLVLWEMLSGRPAGGPAHVTGKPLSLARLPVPPLAEVAPDVPPRLDEIVRQATALDPADRYSDAGQMGYDLEYHIYHKGYGPTIITMERYLRETFPEEPWGHQTDYRDQTLPETEWLTRPPDERRD